MLCFSPPWITPSKAVCTTKWGVSMKLFSTTSELKHLWLVSSGFASWQLVSTSSGLVAP
jgi:hypothetical protein